MNIYSYFISCYYIYDKSLQVKKYLYKYLYKSKNKYKNLYIKISIEAYF